MTTKIVELFIQDMEDESGIEAISLVGRPAHDETWLAFTHDEGIQPSYKICDDTFCEQHPLLNTIGEPYTTLLEDGWEIIKVEHMTPENVLKMSEERFTRSNPNQDSIFDKDKFRVRFKYVGPRDSRNRKFCADMLAANRVYTIEDIDALSDSVANPEFGFYEIFAWRGSYNCRHQWVRLIYKKQGSIINSGDSSKGLIREEGLGPRVQRDTRNEATKRVGETGRLADGSPASATQVARDREPRVGRSFADDVMENPCWEGYEPYGTKILDGKEVPNCVPEKEAMKMMREEFRSYNDYPESAKNNACKALKWKEEHGDEVKGMTQVGWTRANQLCKGENISEETIARMSAFQRHRENSEVAAENKSTPWKDAGHVAWLGWGGTSGVEWAETKLKSIRKEKMGKERMMFYDEDKQVLIGAAMVPNKMIHRYDALGNLYYVFFSKQTIKKMADKFLRQKRTDETSIEHNGIKLGADKVYITESWVSEDPIKDKSASYGFNLPAGTWYVSMKVEDPKIWKLIKSKMLTGFSVEGLFAEKSIFSKDTEIINTIKDILKSIKDE
jgi:hypothetical protein